MTSFGEVNARPSYVAHFLGRLSIRDMSDLKPCWIISHRYGRGVHTHSLSSAWWMRCNCLLYECEGLVRKEGGKAIAARSVLPSMFGNSARTVSHTIPAYEPALWPRMYSAAPMCSACLRALSTGRSGGRQIPTRGCSAISLVNNLRLCLYPGHGGFRCAGVIGPKARTLLALNLCL